MVRLEAPARRPYAQRRDGPPPYAQRRDGPPPYAQRRDGPPPYAQRRDGPPPYAQRRDGPPPYAQRRDGPPPYAQRRDGPPPYAQRRDGPPPYAQRRDGPPPYAQRRDGPPPYAQRRDGPPPYAQRRDGPLPPDQRVEPPRWDEDQIVADTREDSPAQDAGVAPSFRPGPRSADRYDRRPSAGPGRPPIRGAARFPQPRSPGVVDPSVTLAEGEELVAGRRPVEEAFVARREAVRLLVVPQRRMALEKLVLHATSLRIPVVEVEGGTLTAIAGFDGHQGIALVVTPRRFASPDEILALAVERGEPPLVLVLDSLEDPQNVGTLLRSAEATGVHGAMFPTHRQAPLSPAAVKASAGATEHLRLAPVDDLPGVLADLHGRGLRIVGADGDASLTAREADLRGPIAIVVGSEGRGLGPAVRRRCDLLVRIPMHGRIESLNAAVAGSILLYEAAAQRLLGDASVSTLDATVVEDAPDGEGEAPQGDLPASAGDSEPHPSDAGSPDPAAPPEPAAALESADAPPPDAGSDALLPGGPEPA